MIFKPAQLGMAKLDPQELEADKKSLPEDRPLRRRQKGAVPEQLLHRPPLLSALRQHHPGVQAGGYELRRLSGKGVFASMAYLVVEYDGGKQKQCNFKDERDVDALLEVLAKEQPQLHLLSAAGEQALEKKAAEKAARKLPELSEDAQHSLTVLHRAKEYLDAKPELSAELSAAQRRKRAQLQSKPVYRYVALAIFVLGVAAAAYGLYSVFSHTGSYGVYFALFGFAAIFLFSSYNMLPTAHNNNNAIMKRADKAEAACRVCQALPPRRFPGEKLVRPSHRAQADDGRRGGGPRCHRARGTGSGQDAPEILERGRGGGAGGI